VQFQEKIQVNAAAGVLWRAVAEVERWPEWIPAYTEVTWLTGTVPEPEAGGQQAGDGALRPGNRARIRQLRLPEAVWEVTEVLSGTSFSWQTARPGVTVAARHDLTPLDGGKTELTLTLSVSGPLAPVTGRLAGRLTRRSLQQEAAGLKRCAEVAAGTPG
jgi:hypothetical protein